MSRTRLTGLAALLLVVAGVGALILTRRAAGDEDAADPTPTATVTAARLEQRELKDVVQVYGVVQADPAGSATVATPKAAVVSRVVVRAGEAVSAGQPLVSLADAPASQLAWRQAADAATFAQTDLARVQRLFDQHLAASDQLIAAKKTLADAEAGLAAQRKAGAGAGEQTLRAPFAGVVVNVVASPGDRLAQDAPLLALARGDAETAKLGLEPSLGRFAAGQAATIRPVIGGPPIASRLTVVGQAPDPVTKALQATAPLNGAALAIGSGVTADVVTGSHQGLAAPRSAVVFDETGPHLFTLSGGHAHRVFVKVGADHGELIEISGPVQAGALVAVEGAYELQDGMAVRIRAR